MVKRYLKKPKLLDTTNVKTNQEIEYNVVGLLETTC